MVDYMCENDVLDIALASRVKIAMGGVVTLTYLAQKYSASQAAISVVRQRKSNSYLLSNLRGERSVSGNRRQIGW